MTCLPAWRRAILLARLAKKQEQLEAAYDTFFELISSTEESYKLDTGVGGGSQQLKNKDALSLQSVIDNLEAEIDAIYMRLAGKGLVSLNLRRKRYRDWVGSCR